VIRNLWSVQDTSQTSSPISVPWRRSRHSSQVRRNNLELNSFLRAFTFVCNALYVKAVPCILNIVEIHLEIHNT